MVTVGPTGSEKGATSTLDDADVQPIVCIIIIMYVLSDFFSYQLKKSVSVLNYFADIGHDLLP